MGQEAFVHETACIDAPCHLGEGTRIWHFSHVMAGARIGTGCNIGQNVYVDADVVIGDSCKIQNNVSVYKGVTLEDSVFCGPSVVFTNVINPRALIERKHELRPTLVQRGATLGANCAIVCDITIGAYALIGAGSVVTKDVPAYGMFFGVPGRLTGWVSEEGIVLQADGDDFVCPESDKRYRLTEGGLSPVD